MTTARFGSYRGQRGLVKLVTYLRGAAANCSQEIKRHAAR